MRYLSQRFTMPNRMAMAVLNDIGTEELAHLEMVSTIVHQLTKDLSMEEIEKSGFGPYYIDHTVGVWPQAAGGVPFNACEFQSKGDPITDLFEDLAAEQKARATYDNILRVVRDIPEIADPIRFLRAREVVHFQRFGKHFVPYRNSWMRKTSMHSIQALTVHVRRPVKIHNNKEISNKTWEDSSGSFRVNTGFYNSFHPCYYDNALNMKGKRSWKF